MRISRFPALDERGVALPVALFGLVAVSLLVTTALLTSSTELALSRAHQDGTRGLFNADAALEQFVAERAALGASPVRFEDGVYDLSAAGDPYRISVATLYRGPLETLPSGAVQSRETFSLVASRADQRGRGVGALIDVVRSATPASFNIDSGLTLGTNTTISGSATVSDGSDASLCHEPPADYAIRHSSDSNLRRQGRGHDVVGDIVEDHRAATELMTYVMDGKTIHDLTALAQIRFGPMFDRPLFSGSPGANHSNPSYRWGCPAQLQGGCSAAAAEYYPVVAIDAGGGTVDITGGHGQGILIIRNGHIHIRGNFVFQGIVLVEGSLQIRGNPRIEGAVVVLGDETVIDPEDSSVSNGNPTIRYNACQVQAAQQATVQSLNTAPQTIVTPTYAWFEVTR